MSDGFAIRRRSSCWGDEVDCGQTDKPYRACCPAKSFCPAQWNIDCCASDRNCTQDLYKKPSCANETWDLYDNEGYFCCQPGLPGYNMATRGSSGCASPGYTYEGGEKPLPVVKKGTDSNANTGDSGVPGGAIAGAVVGAVVGVALIAGAIWWFFIRKRRARRAELAAEAARPVSDKGSGYARVDGPPRELDIDGGASSRPPGELDGTANEKRELDGGYAPSELAAGGRFAGKPVQLAEQHGVSELPG